MHTAVEYPSNRMDAIRPMMLDVPALTISRPVPKDKANTDAVFMA
jgi:hypothetical protein